MALRKQPVVNSSWGEQAIRRYGAAQDIVVCSHPDGFNTLPGRYNNIDINVAVNTSDGLFTPIVPDADKKGLQAISNTVKELATKAKEKKLVPSDYEVGFLHPLE